MIRRVFFSFHYANDAWEVAKIRNIWVIRKKAGEIPPFYDKAEWEQIKRGSHMAVQKWIDNQMSGTSCVIVLNGQETKNRPWVQYEINKAHREGKAMFGIHLSNIKDRLGNKHSSKGPNPFVNVNMDAKRLSPSYTYEVYSPKDYQEVYDNIDLWIEQAIIESKHRHRLGV